MSRYNAERVHVDAPMTPTGSLIVRRLSVGLQTQGADEPETVSSSPYSDSVRELGIHLW